MTRNEIDDNLEHVRDMKVKAGIEKRQPWGFCVTKDSECTMNMCDEYGCQDRKREHVPTNDKPETLK